MKVHLLLIQNTRQNKTTVRLNIWEGVPYEVELYEDSVWNVHTFAKLFLYSVFSPNPSIHLHFLHHIFDRKYILVEKYKNKKVW